MDPSDFEAYSALYDKNPRVTKLTAGERKLIVLSKGTDEFGRAILALMDDLAAKDQTICLQNALVQADTIYHKREREQQAAAIAAAVAKPVWVVKPDNAGYRLLVERIKMADLSGGVDGELDGERWNFSLGMLDKLVPPPNGTRETEIAFQKAVGKIEGGVILKGSLDPEDMRLLTEALLVRENPKTGDIYLTKKAVGALFVELDKKHPNLLKGVTFRDAFIESTQQFMTGKNP